MQYETGELNQIIFLVFEDVLGFSRTDMTLRKKEILSEEKKSRLAYILTRLQQGDPLQYILGYSWFAGLKISVSKDVLIPRQETEELVTWIVNDNVHYSNLKISDICTGSGCIALALKNNLPQAAIEAADVSESALKIAGENSLRSGLSINFTCVDVFKIEKLPALQDIIVSNPPYVTLAERSLMNDRVLNHEPHLALFVPENDPLIFYRRISLIAKNSLNDGGKIYFEINEIFSREITELLASDGFKNIECRKDLNDRPRMIKAVR